MSATPEELSALLRANELELLLRLEQISKLRIYLSRIAQAAHGKHPEACEHIGKLCREALNPSVGPVHPDLGPAMGTQKKGD